MAGFACILNGDGEVTDFLRLPHIMKRKNPHLPVQRQEKEQELDKLKEFIYEKKPHVIAISGESRFVPLVCQCACLPILSFSSVCSIFCVSCPL